LCSWEHIIYTYGHRGKIYRQAYSCNVYACYIYDKCSYSREDKIFEVISYEECGDCAILYKFVSFQDQ
ncbi:hypothetical protein QBC36DRAFT_199223, partial [Triangularia setosa]